MGVHPLENEKSIIEELRKGDFGAFEDIYNYYFEILFMFTRKYLKNDEEAEELVQHVFLKVWESRDSINADLPFKAFIFKITLNNVYNHIRKKRFEKVAYKIYAESVPSSDESTQELFFYTFLKEKLDKLIEKLPAKRRDIFILSRNKGFSNQDIATQLHLSVRTVENQLHRALAYLKENLANDIE